MAGKPKVVKKRRLMKSTIYTSYSPKAGGSAVLKNDINKKAAEAGFSNEKLDELEIILTEMTSNLLTAKGELLLCIAEEKNKRYLELICIDTDPGIADQSTLFSSDTAATEAEKAFEGIRSRSDHFEIHKLIGWGTMLICRIFKNSDRA
jgi:anti-sigma regulatory factor (Ser/Thr protein kinase)